MNRQAILFLLLCCAGCSSVPESAAPAATGIADIAEIAEGWQAEIAAVVDQSYAGWDVEIGDADNDGRNEILATGAPNSQLLVVERRGDAWAHTVAADNLAQSTPGMGLAVRVVDLDGDGSNEVILGTGQELGGTAWFYVLELDAAGITRRRQSRPAVNGSPYTHNLAVHDLDGDGVQEVLSAYCGGGEIIRYDVDPHGDAIEARKLHQLSGSGEESILADVDNDGRVEYITANAFRKDAAKVEIFELDERGELITPSRLVLECYDDRKCFYASLIVGDLDNDGRQELVVGWKREQTVNRGTLLAYRIDEAATVAYTLAYEDEALDMSYFEKMMVIADADNDGANELVISTRGDDLSERISSDHLGHVFLYEVSKGAEPRRELLVDFDPAWAESSWVAVGDADGDGRNEVVLATGKGDRTKPGTSYIVVVRKSNGAR